MKKSFIIVLFGLLASCMPNTSTDQPISSPIPDIQKIKNRYLGFTIDIPNEANKALTRSDGSDAFTTNLKDFYKKEGDFYIQIYDSTLLVNKKGKNISIGHIAAEDIIGCDPYRMGMEPEDVKKRADGMYWGRLDPSTAAGNGIQNNICGYPANEKCTKELYWSKGCGDLGGGAYSLCGEHNGKTVLVCISQVKDDPVMAEKIFNSFRWTK